MRITLRNVSHNYRVLPVLHDIDLQVESGEVVVFLGPSGCGKSTLLHLVGGLEVPTTGAIFQDPCDFGDSIAYVFQEPTLLPWRTAAGNVALPLEHRNLSTKEQDRLVDNVLAGVRLARFADFYPRDLSGGMRQRVGLARALIVRPAALLMDEPFGSLDELNREHLMVDFVRLWRASPFTCLYVTHNPLEAVRLANRVVVLTERPGRIRDIIPIDIPIDKRSESHPTIIAARDRIWDLIRNPEQ